MEDGVVVKAEIAEGPEEDNNRLERESETVGNGLTGDNGVKKEDEVKVKVEILDGRETLVIDLAPYGLTDAVVLKDAPQDNFRNSVYSAVLGGNPMDTVPTPDKKKIWPYGGGERYIRAKWVETS
ncbi:hypothetical protein HK104_007869 [Borealophlyctis nickersoniae]|nr:hypothetical protein HK104_007869 [Borealophlyctis nickersoniae]